MGRSEAVVEMKVVWWVGEETKWKGQKECRWELWKVAASSSG